MTAYIRMCDMRLRHAGDESDRTVAEYGRATDEYQRAVAECIQVEYDYALVAKVEAAQAKADAARVECERAMAVHEHMLKWVEREMAKGRPEHELTWGKCVRETGVLLIDGVRVQ
jgi:hypothetical protein